MKTCVMCAFFPAAWGESICDFCYKKIPGWKPEAPEPEPVSAVTEPKLDFQSALGREYPRRLPYGRVFRNGRVA